ncbi:MAG: hypothetical protein AAB601_02765 [Patescibacteria group bacterium]
MPRLSFQHGANEEKRPRLVRRWFLIVAAAVLLLGGGIIGVCFFILSSETFSVSLRVPETRLVLPREILKSLIANRMKQGGLARFIGPDNYLFWRTRSRNDLFPLTVPAVATISTAADFGRREVGVDVTERILAGVWCVPRADDGLDGRRLAGAVETGMRIATTTATSTLPEVSVSPREQCYAFDDNGILFAEAPNMHGVLVFLVHDTNASRWALGQRVLPDESWYRRLRETVSILTEHIGPPVAVVVRDTILKEWEAQTASGARFYFSFDFVPENIPGVLRALAERMPLRDLSYVDFRVPNRVYYK